VNWLVVGSSPNAPAALKLALALHPNASTITTNAGFQLFTEQPPAVYFLADYVACKLWAQTAADLQARGTRFVVPAREPLALVDRGITHADEYIDVNRTLDAGRHHPGQYAGHALSGLYCLDYAVNNGATAVTLAGFDGYGSNLETQVPDYFDGRDGHRNSERHNQRTAGYLESLLRETDVEVVNIGEPRYTVAAHARYRVLSIGRGSDR